MAHDELIKDTKYVLILTGLWPFELTKNAFFNRLYRAYCIFQITLITVTTLSLASRSCTLILMHDQPNRMFRAITFFIVALQVSVKLFLLKLKKIPDLFSHVMESEETISKSQDLEIKQCYKRDISYCRNINLLQLIGIFVAVSLMTLSSLVQYWSSDHASKYKDQPFIFDIWFPGAEDHTYSVIFCNLFILVPAVLCDSVTHTTLICLIVYVKARLKILQIKLRKFEAIAAEDYKGDIFQTLQQFIREHQHLILFVKALNKKLSYVLLFEYVLNSACLATAVIQMLQGNYGLTQITNCITSCCIAAQVFLFIWNVNEISIQGCEIADAIYASNWEEQLPEIRKLFVIMMATSQKPIGICLGPFPLISNGTALQTVRVAYTYLSIMMK